MSNENDGFVTGKNNGARRKQFYKGNTKTEFNKEQWRILTRPTRFARRPKEKFGLSKKIVFAGFARSRYLPKGKFGLVLARFARKAALGSQCLASPRAVASATIGGGKGRRDTQAKTQGRKGGRGFQPRGLRRKKIFLQRTPLFFTVSSHKSLLVSTSLGISFILVASEVGPQFPHFFATPRR